MSAASPNHSLPLALEAAQAVSALEAGQAPAPPTRAQGAAPRGYRLYGLRVGSDVALPIPPEPPGAPDDATFDCLIARARPGQPRPEPDGRVLAGLPCDAPCHNGQSVALVQRGAGGTWFWNETVGTCHVAPDARRVDVYLEAGFDERALELMLVGQVMTFVLHQLGYPSLHASAVLTERGAVAFLGLPQQGKSGMAAYFLRRGAALVADDVLPLRARRDGVYGGPSLPMMKLWPRTVTEVLRLSGELPSLTAKIDKKLLLLDGQLAFAPTPVRLAAVYVLDRYDARAAGRTVVSSRRLSARDGLMALLAQTSNRAFLRPAEGARLLPLYARLVSQAPVSVLSYPDGFEHQERAYERIMADLAAP